MRTRRERQTDALTRLRTDRDVWVATAGADGTPHLVPLSLCWHAGEVLLATAADRRLARDVESSGRARLGLGSGEDVVLIDAAVTTLGWAQADAALTRAFVDRVGWDPGREPGAWVLMRLAPRRMRVWRTEAENVSGSLVMRDGEWLS